jgi:syntaxin 1B/2/3
MQDIGFDGVWKKCREINIILKHIDEQLEPASKQSRPSVNDIREEIEKLKIQVEALISWPESHDKTNAAQVSNVKNNLAMTQTRYRDFRARVKKGDQITAKRQYRIVRPDATEDEIRENVSSDVPIFQQAVSGIKSQATILSSLQYANSLTLVRKFRPPKPGFVNSSQRQGASRRFSWD